MQLNTSQNKEHKVKMPIPLLVWMIAGSTGIGIVSVFTLVYGLQFHSSYSLWYIFGGLLCLPYGIITTSFWLPAFIKNGRTLFIIKPGEHGYIESGRKRVLFRDIRNLEVKHDRKCIKGLFLEELLVTTHQEKLVKFPANNTVTQAKLESYVNEFIFPHMSNEAKNRWLKKMK